ncbi:Fe(3+) ABC transporter substrate-binding protein [Defluviimonas sp. WL0075]|uniref:Fe(3+) ABC transporter substrate-binding protein n=1 Tax=Albidovulum sediminicola TaxID=2984331 RepID=A0ABT2Z0Q0_9RHOB|nr:Fe(3+) ABC transporter substrate-binding protein [Defluviimonas sp. WL0075]MCV2864663.1 Fe(3+) ABC transporter substrate-binding protein [Defluviimonas sp. WL0075]
MKTLMMLSLPLLAIALPAAAQEVNVYSHRQPELVQPLFDAFTQETGIEVNVAYVDKGMVERLVSEGSRSPADLVMTVDIARLAQIVDAGVTQPVESEVLAANIPAEFRDPGNQWFGLTSRARIVYASKERVADGEVTTYEDLADPKWQGRICTRPGTHDYNLGLMAGVIAHDGEEAAKEWATALRANLARKPEGNDRGQVKSIWAGECDISLGNTYYMGEMLADPEQKEWADSVRIVYPVFKDGGTHVNVSGVAMTKAAPHHDDALKLMEYLSSDAAQKIYAEINHEFPVKPGVPSSDLVESWGPFTPDSVNLMDLARLRPDALRIMEEVNFDG